MQRSCASISTEKAVQDQSANLTTSLRNVVQSDTGHRNVERWKVQMDPYITRGRAVGKVNGVCVANILHQSIFQYYFHCTVHYASSDEVVKLVVHVGKGAFMAKADIESAFRLLPVHPRDFCLLGMKVNDFYLIDKSLPIGGVLPSLIRKVPYFLRMGHKKSR